MKKVSKIAVFALAVVSLAVSAAAQGFAKTQNYTEGKFTDVANNKWYAAEVKSSYELGLMNGQSDTLFAPEGNVTVAEGITMASRVHSIYNGKTIAEKSGSKWYDMYIAYALENGLIEEGQFANYDRNIMRYEMASMFAKAMPKSYFAAKNDIKDIPDVAKTEEYYDDLMMLYKAGVVMGSDDYGNFYATNPITRSETAAIINRVALPENRKSGTLLEYGNREQAVYLIDDEIMTRSPHGIDYIASGWTYESPEDSASKKQDYSTNILGDSSENSAVTIRKEIVTTQNGTLGFHADYIATAPGSKVWFEDLEGNKLFEIMNKDGTFYAVGNTEKSTGYGLKMGQVRLKIDFDLDNGTAKVVINDNDCGVFELGSAKDMSRVCMGTGEKEKLSMTVSSVTLYQNFDVHEDFRLGAADGVPFGWETSGDVKVAKKKSDYDTLSAVITNSGKAEKRFAKVDGKLVYETFIRVPEGQKGVLTLKNGNDTALSVVAGDGKISTSDGKLIRNYTNDIWQLVRVEADTDSDKAFVKINGKECMTVPFTADGVDAVEISAEGTGSFYFDDVLLYNTFDYPDYCPVPVPVNDDEWYAGMSICSLWRDGTHYGWDAIAPFDELSPVIGYYDEGLPEVADWEIKFMAEHGYDYQRFCWYYGEYKDGIKEPRLGAALHDGYFNAKYSDMLDFAVMWENAGNKNSKDDFYNNIWPYWVDWYLTDERYFCIDNKPVITIYSPDAFKSSMGGVDGVKEAISFMREECKKLGYADAIIYCSNISTDAAYNKELADCGYDAKVAYHFGTNAYDIEYQKKSMNGAFDAGSITFTPSAGIGVNYVGWWEQRTPLASSEDFEKVLRWSRDEYLPKYEASNSDLWQTKSVFTNTWNEYGEGHYVSPTGLCGFDYLDAHRHVFSSVADTPDTKHFDVVPTDNQKARLNYLYAARHIPMRKLYLETSNEDVYEKLAPVIKWDFETQEDCNKWELLANSTAPKYDPDEKAFVGETLTNDGHIRMANIPENYFDGGKCKYLHVYMKVEEGGGKSAQIYYVNNTSGNWSGSMGKNFDIIADGEYHDYYVDLSKATALSGEIKSLRFDPNNSPAGYAIKTIEFLSDTYLNGFTIEVDGVDFVFDDLESKNVDGEIYVDANPATGFYAFNHFYYEWNRWNGKLLVRAQNGTEFNFTVGSNKVLVDGVEMTLKKEIEVHDGLVTLPITFIYDNAGYNYTVEDGKITVKLRDENVEDSISSRVENEFEFNVDGDFEGWETRVSSATVNDGYVAIFPELERDDVYDPQFINQKLNVDTRLYDTITVRMKQEDDPSYNKHITDVVIYFATATENSFAGDKQVRVNMANLTADEDGFKTATFNMASHAKWTGICTGIRIDPSNGPGVYTIDYVRINRNAEGKLSGEEDEETKKLMAADEGAPFYIKNADAEDEIFAYDFKNDTSTVTVVDDDLRPGNKAFLVTPNGNEMKIWSYFRVKTRFKPGVTYKVDYEYRLLGDLEGNAAENVEVCPNFRYSDEKNGEVKVMVDHATGAKRVSTSDGWIKMSVTHKISEKSLARGSDQFTVYTGPSEVDGKITNYKYMIDNIVVTVVDGGTSAPAVNDDALLMAADEGKPFYIKNADAENPAIASEFKTTQTTVTVVDDDLRPGNKALLVTTDITDSKVWAYICFKTRFKPGVTYKVDFEYRLVGSAADGSAGNTEMSPNFRYADFNKDGSVKAMMDHPVGGKKVSTSDGWIKMSVKHTVKADSPSREKDQFAIYTGPSDIDGNITNYQYMIDNIVVTVVE